MSARVCRETRDHRRSAGLIIKESSAPPVEGEISIDIEHGFGGILERRKPVCCPCNHGPHGIAAHYAASANAIR